MTRVGQAETAASRHPGAVDAGSLSNAVRFEVRDHATGVRLMQRLAPRWAARFCVRDDICTVRVSLRPEKGDLARLLREVERFVAGEVPAALRYELDGRNYVLWAEGDDQGR